VNSCRDVSSEVNGSSHLAILQTCERLSWKFVFNRGCCRCETVRGLQFMFLTEMNGRRQRGSNITALLEPT